MEVTLTGAFIRNSKIDDYDMRQVKKALNRLGYYQPYETVGITPIPDVTVFEGLKNFQKHHGLSPTGEIKPDDKTFLALNKALKDAPDGYYIWRTVGDNKVRSSHKQYEGSIRAWSDTPDPGENYNCRCWAQIAEPGLNAVYPELFLLPLTRIKNLYGLWKIWLYKQDTDWTLGTFKSPVRWGNQMKNRDWTPGQITHTIQHGKRYPVPNKVNPGNTATRYEYKDRFVVRDDKTKEILQVSREDFYETKLMESKND